MNKENLKKLADYLLKGELKAGFNMSIYSSLGDLSDINCGTAGCAVGHGPYAGIEKHKGEDWLEYSSRVFVKSDNNYIWDWCFSPDWKYIDNTPQGAGKRIIYVLEYGLPRWFDICDINKEKYFTLLNSIQWK